MAIALKHQCSVKNGKIIYFDIVRWQNQLNALNNTECYLTICKKTRQRSLNELRYYRGVVIPIAAEFLGYEEEEEMHNAFKWEFLKKHDEGKPFPTVYSLSDEGGVNTVKMEDYLSKIRQKMAEMGCYIPMPNEVEIKE